MSSAPPGFDPHHSQTARQKWVAFVQVVLLVCIVTISGLFLLGELGAFLMGYRDMLESSGLIKTIVTSTVFVVSSIRLRTTLTRFSRPLK
jgi:hypothetical protein